LYGLKILGYYARVTTKGEVKDKVLRYLNIMSRPMVMQQSHAVVWTNVYAHIAVSEVSHIISITFLIKLANFQNIFCTSESG